VIVLLLYWRLGVYPTLLSFSTFGLYSFEFISASGTLPTSKRNWKNQSSLRFSLYDTRHAWTKTSTLSGQLVKESWGIEETLHVKEEVPVTEQMRVKEEMHVKGKRGRLIIDDEKVVVGQEVMVSRLLEVGEFQRS